MHVLYWIEGTVAKIPGGHIVQFEQTMRHVQELGIDATMTFERPRDLTQFDIVHGYNLSADDVRYCKNNSVPVVLSTIYWSMNYRYEDADPSIVGRFQKIKSRLRLGLVLFLNAALGNHQTICRNLIRDQYEKRAAYEAADLLLPNSHGEAALVADELGTTTPQRVVVNGVDHRVFASSGCDTKRERDYVLYCGRFEPRKNQLGLIKAVQGLNIPIKLVGPLHKDHPRYYAQCKAAAKGAPNVEILDPVPVERLVDLYRGAKVHAIPSFFETTGLVSLEAALCGCNVVTANRGHVREYFGDDVWWCDPYEIGTIRTAVTQAFNAPFNARLKERVLREFTWQQTARQTVEGYMSVLNGETNSLLHAVDRELAALTLV